METHPRLLLRHARLHHDRARRTARASATPCARRGSSATPSPIRATTSPARDVARKALILARTLGPPRSSSTTSRSSRSSRTTSTTPTRRASSTSSRRSTRRSPSASRAREARRQGAALRRARSASAASASASRRWPRRRRWGACTAPTNQVVIQSQALPRQPAGRHRPRRRRAGHRGGRAQRHRGDHRAGAAGRGGRRGRQASRARTTALSGSRRSGVVSCGARGAAAIRARWRSTSGRRRRSRSCP